LGFDSVFRGAKKLFDSQMLFDPFEKYFYSPPVAIQLSDRQCRQQKLIGEENE
jgi:hypothetical protein